ncbi:MAG: ABC transporter ATP-binding protein [Spirochaetaceae bacterium]|jgi:peptide/nickel transport system ATP-binding protein/oligopeptide transport system ATP-binding protein|nr:ABC transporter ATP-binding protein [Spirochaetaceae bacterium]
MESLFSIRDLRKYYPLGKKKREGRTEEVVLKALDGLSFDIFPGETLGVVGESGSGKSTLGRCILNLISPTGGSVLFRGKPIESLRSWEMKSLRQDMQMVFQNPSSSFNPKLTIGRTLRNVAYFYDMGRQEGRDRINRLLAYVNLDQTVLSRRSEELSGGQLQRLAILRALIPSPAFIMADEPVSALDVSVQAQILNLLDDMKKEFGLTMMFISHELTVVEHICDRILVMYLGTIIEMGDTEDLFSHTAHPYTRALIAAKPKMYPDEETERVVLEGEVPNALDIPQGCRFYSRCPQAVSGRCDKAPPPLREVSGGHWVACYLVQGAASSRGREVMTPVTEQPKAI